MLQPCSFCSHQAGNIFHECRRYPQLLWIEEHRPGNPEYIMLDSIKDTFRCITPLPVLHKNDPVFKDKVQERCCRDAVQCSGTHRRTFAVSICRGNPARPLLAALCPLGAAAAEGRHWCWS